MTPYLARRRVLRAGGAALLLGGVPRVALAGPEAGETGGTARVDALLAAMTLEEKIGQLTMLTAGLTVTGPGGVPGWAPLVRAGRVGNMLNLKGRGRVRDVQRMALEETRLGVPLLLGFDVLHGYRTLFPVPIGEAAAFDPGLWERTARAAAAEAAADGLALTFAPMLDVARDPRWGRMVESPGEDPWLAARFAEAKVRGFEGGGLGATAKHLAGYGAVAAGREYASVDVSERTFAEVYLPPFRAAVEAGVAAIMPAFVTVAGTPMAADAGLLQDVVRAHWGFDGVIISDYGAVAELVTLGAAADLAEAAALALAAGIDIDMMSDAYPKGLPLALERGLVGMAQVDAAVRRVLRLKERLGLFADPYRERIGSVQPEELRTLAREAAYRSLVLLTNRNGRLPLGEGVRRIAVLGPFADARRDMLGPWSAAGRVGGTVTVLEGVRRIFPESAVVHARGVEADGADGSEIAAALDAARTTDVTILCLGEPWWMSGEGASRARPDLPGRQAELADAVLELGRPVVVVLFAGRPLLVPWLVERADAVLAAWFPGTEAGNALAGVLRGRVAPSGRLPVTWPAELGQVPIFFGELPTGRPAEPGSRYSSKYLDAPTGPLFPFGHGLSYGRFAFHNLRASAAELRRGERLTVAVEVVNEGPMPGEETVLLFVRARVPGRVRPALELKGMAKAVLAPGERREVGFALAAEELAAGPNPSADLEPGDYELLVGPVADRNALLATGVQVLA
jgi:beta-glucosidase